MFDGASIHNALMSPIEHLPPMPPLRGGLRHLVMKEVLKDIFRGHLPAGERLMVMKLAARFGTSSTPCREALVELEAIGVVEFIHNRGAEVAPFGPSELGEIYQLRRVLETEATRCACGRIDRGVLGALRDEIVALRDAPYDADWSRRQMQSDLRLHGLIAAECGSRRLLKEIHRYDTLVETIREIIGHHRQSERRALEGHLRIVDAMLAGDPDTTAEAMAAHIRESAESAVAAMFDARPAS